MSLIKYNTNQFRPFIFNSLFDGFFNDDGIWDKKRTFVPQVDISETDKVFDIQFVVPGMDKKGFNIDLQDGKLAVSGERKLREEKNEKNFYSIESFHGSFNRSFYLPDNINEEKVEANYANGILTISIPKNEKKTVKTNITVK